MTEEHSQDEYTLDELIKCLEKIKVEGSGPINFPKAFLCLIKEIQKMKDTK